MVHKIRGDQKPFTEVMSMALHEGTDTQRIDVVLDVFRDHSIKTSERGAQKGVMNSETSRQTTRYAMAEMPIQFQK